MNFIYELEGFSTYKAEENGSQKRGFHSLMPAFCL